MGGSLKHYERFREFQPCIERIEIATSRLCDPQMRQTLMGSCRSGELNGT